MLKSGLWGRRKSIEYDKTMTAQPPNTLGRWLHYWSSALAYAREPLQAKTRQSQRIMLGLLDKLGDRQPVRTIDSTEAEILAITSYTVFTALRVIGSAVARESARPFAATRQADGDIIKKPSHPFDELLRSPNDLMPYDYIAKYTTGWLLLRGIAHIFVATPRVGKGEPVELWPLPSNMVSPLPNTLRRSRLTGRLTHDWEMTIKGAKTTLPGENMFCLRLPNYWDYWNGLSSLTAALAPIRTDIAQANWEEGFYGEDNAVPTAILSLPPEISNDDFDEAKIAIREQFGEGRSSAIVRGGDLSVEVIQQTMEQMQLRLAREFNRDQIYQVLGIPAGLVTGEVSTENLYAVQASFAQFTIQPILDSFAAQWTLALRPFYGDDFLAQSPNVVPQDRAIAVQEYAQYGQDRSINQNLKVQGLPPVPYPICDLPVRLLKHLAAPGGVEVLRQGVGTLLGGEAPERLTNRLAGGSDDVPEEPEDQGNVLQEEEKALRVAVKGELNRWRKVALGELQKGKPPADRTFTTALIPESVALEIVSQLKVAEDEDSIRAVFAKANDALK